MRAQAGEKTLDSRRRAQVGLLRLRLHAQVANFSQRRGDGEVIRAVVMDEDVVTGGGQFQRDGAPDAFRGAGDQRDAAGRRRAHA